MIRDLYDLIRRRKATVAVIGLGYVGLPTAAVIAAKGYHVVGVDANRRLLRRLSRRKIPPVSRDLRKLLLESLRSRSLTLSASTVTATSGAQVVIVCVPTPLKNRRPNLRHLSLACRQIAKGLSRDKLILIESTVPPGTTGNMIVNTLQTSGLRCGSEFWLAYCPERLTPSNAYTEVIGNPRLIGGIDPRSGAIAAGFYRQIIKARVYLTDAITAEISKLAENSYRDVNIAFANELATICEALGADVYSVVKMANTHPRVQIHQPGIGVGGPCLTKDPYFLIHSTGAQLLSVARRINDHMPLHVLQKILRAVDNRNLRGRKVAVLGVTYKEDTDDTRNSPTKPIVHHLLEKGANVVVHDPYSKETYGARPAGSISAALKGADCCFIAVAHTPYRALSMERASRLMKVGASIVDGRNIFNPHEVIRTGLRYYGVGKGQP